MRHSLRFRYSIIISVDIVAEMEREGMMELEFNRVSNEMLRESPHKSQSLLFILMISF